MSMGNVAPIHTSTEMIASDTVGEDANADERVLKSWTIGLDHHLHCIPSPRAADMRFIQPTAT